MHVCGRPALPCGAPYWGSGREVLIVAKLVVRNLRSRGVHFLSGACSNAYGCYHKQRECLAKQLSLNNRNARCQMLHSPRTAIEGWRQVLDARQFGATYVCGYVSTHARYRDLVRDRTCRQLAWRPEKPLAGPCADLQKMSCDWHYAFFFFFFQMFDNLGPGVLQVVLRWRHAIDVPTTYTSLLAAPCGNPTAISTLAPQRAAVTPRLSVSPFCTCCSRHRRYHPIVAGDQWCCGNNW